MTENWNRIPSKYTPIILLLTSIGIIFINYLPSLLPNLDPLIIVILIIISIFIIAISYLITGVWGLFSKQMTSLHYYFDDEYKLDNEGIKSKIKLHSGFFGFLRYIIATLIGLILLSIVSFIIYNIYLSSINKSSSTKSTVINLQPPKKSEEIIWKTHNFTDKDKSIVFSFQYPDPAYCNGYLDTAGRSENFSGIWIRGSCYEKINYDWNLTVNVFKPSVKFEEGIPYDENISKLINNYQSLNVGKTYEEENENVSIKVTRLKDVLVFEKPNMQFIVNNGQQTRQVALVQLDNNIIVINYSYDSPIYDVFNKILTSFSYQIYDNPQTGETLKNYNNRQDGQWPTL